MLRLLLNKSFVVSNLIRNPSTNQNVIRKTLDTYVLSRKSVINTIKTSFKPKTSVKCNKKESTILKLFIAGTGITLTVGLHGKKYFAHCEAETNRLISLKHPSEDVSKFDWVKFWSYLKPHLLKLIGAVFAALAVAYFNIQIPNFLGILVNTLSRYAGVDLEDIDSSNFLKEMRGPALNLCGMYLAQAGFTFIYIFLLSQIGEQMAAKIRQDLFNQIIIQDLSFFDENRTGELVNRLTADVQDFKSSFKQCISQGLRSFAQLIGGGISLFLISPQLAGIALVSVPAAVYMFSLLGRSLRALSKKSQAQSERATTVCEEALSNIRTVRSSACEFAEVELFKKETDKAAEIAQELGIGIAVFQSLTNLCINGMVLTTLFLGGHFMSTNSISPGDLMAFLVASQGVQRSLAQGSILMGSVIRGLTAGTRVFEYLSIVPQVKLKEGIKIPENEIQGEIQFENVSFAYPSRMSQIVLDEFSLVLKPGQTVALVGASGSGKSTVASLLERFYEPTEGRITIDGYNLKDISPYWLRGELIGFIEQQPILFGTTIYENIKYGRPNVSKEEVIEAAKLSQSHDFIVNLPDGYDTNVGERGVQLSGGQRQRIAIARALLKQPKVLILDEATSALDSSSEAIVQKALDAAVVNRTTLVIAHRLSTIKNANVIIVLSEGNIVEMGDHESLMEKKGFYFELVRQQERHQKHEHSRIYGSN